MDVCVILFCLYCPMMGTLPIRGSYWLCSRLRNRISSQEPPKGSRAIKWTNPDCNLIMYPEPTDTAYPLLFAPHKKPRNVWTWEPSLNNPEVLMSFHWNVTSAEIDMDYWLRTKLHEQFLLIIFWYFRVCMHSCRKWSEEGTYNGTWDICWLSAISVGFISSRRKLVWRIFRR
jgi:hypothetical protein